MIHAVSVWLWREKQTVLWGNDAVSLENGRGGKKGGVLQLIVMDRAFCPGFVC